MSKTQDMKISPITIFSFLIGAKILDLATTYIGLKYNYGYEMNPISLYVINNFGFPLMVITSLIVMMGVSIMLIRSQVYFEEKEIPISYRKFCKYFIYFCFGLNMLVVLNNLYVIFSGAGFLI